MSFYMLPDIDEFYTTVVNFQIPIPCQEGYIRSWEPNIGWVYITNIFIYPNLPISIQNNGGYFIWNHHNDSYDYAVYILDENTNMFIPQILYPGQNNQFTEKSKYILQHYRYLDSPVLVNNVFDENGSSTQP